MNISEKVVWGLLFLYIGLLCLSAIRIVSNNKLLISENQALIQQQIDISRENNDMLHSLIIQLSEDRAEAEP